MDDPNFERWSCSDVSRIGTSVANPLVSPQSVVGIHFEVRTVEGLIINPPPLVYFIFIYFIFFLNSCGKPHIQAASGTHTQTGYNVNQI